MREIAPVSGEESCPGVSDSGCLCAGRCVRLVLANKYKIAPVVALKHACFPALREGRRGRRRENLSGGRQSLMGCLLLLLMTGHRTDLPVHGSSPNP